MMTRQGAPELAFHPSKNGLGHFRAIVYGTVVISLFTMSSVTQAAQYRSETKELPGYTAPSGPATDNPEALLKSTEGNPYARALTLQQLAGQAAKNKDYATAVKRLEEALKLNALSDIAAQEMRTSLATLYVNQGQHAKAIGMLQKAVQGEGAKDPDLHYALAAAYVGTKKYSQAIGPLGKAMSLSKVDKPEWYDLKFAIHHKLGQLDKAVKVLEQRIAKFGPDKETWMQMAALNSQLKRFDKATAAMALAYREGALTTEAELKQLAGLYIRAGAPYEAGALVDQWINGGKLKNTAANWEYLAGVWLKAKERKRALAAMAKAAEKTGKPGQYLEIAQLNMELENWSQAANAIGQAFRKGLAEKRAGEAYIALGWSQYQMGQMEQATGSFTAAAGYKKSAKLARQWLEFIRLGIGPSQVAKQDDGGIVPEDESYLSPAETALAVAPTSRRSRSVGAASGGGQGYPTGDKYIPMGGIRAGTPDGRIPAWTGGIHPGNLPKAYEAGGPLIDPFPNDKPLFVIDKSNLGKYEDFLSEGHVRLLKQYDSYKMPVYETRRTAAYPEAIYKATLENQKTARLVDPDILQGAKLGFPFRRPKTGNEVIWNHRARYRGDSISMHNSMVVMQPTGANTQFKFFTEVMFAYGNLSNPGEIKEGHLLLYYLNRVIAPSRMSGMVVLAHETTDLKRGRQVWVGPPGLRRLFRVPPNIGYDYQTPGTGGLQFLDQINMYNGGFNKYTWQLHGRKPMYVPYNAYRAHDRALKYKELVPPGHFNQDVTRYELRRVWVVEAETRPGEHHNFKRRVFYVDEDAYGILMVDCYDKDGELWRFQEGHAIGYYQVPMTTTGPELIYDLRDKRYLAAVLTNEEEPASFGFHRHKPVYFTPAKVKGLLR